MSDDFNSYPLYGIDHSEARPLHELVTEFKETLFENQALQNLFFNDGYALPDEERPSSFLEIRNSIFFRTKTMVHLLHLIKNLFPVKDIEEKQEGIIIRPDQACLIEPVPQMVIPVEFAGPELDIYELIRQRKEDEEMTGIIKDISGFSSGLARAFHEYNLQFTLMLMHHARGHFILHDGEEKDLQSRIHEVFKPKYYNDLSDTYYCKAGSIMPEIGECWARLQQYEKGRELTLTVKQEHELMAKAISR